MSNIPCARAPARKAERQAEIHRMILSSGSLLLLCHSSGFRAVTKEKRRDGASPAACRLFRSLHIITTLTLKFYSSSSSSGDSDSSARNDEAVAPPQVQVPIIPICQVTSGRVRGRTPQTGRNLVGWYQNYLVVYVKGMVWGQFLPVVVVLYKSHTLHTY